MTAPHPGPKHSLPYDASAGYSGYDAVLSAAMKRIDSLLTPSVKSRTTTTPPGSPSDGDAYIVPGTGATGAWIPYANKYVWYDLNQGIWQAYTPTGNSANGWVVYVEDEKRAYRSTGSGWYQISTIHADPVAGIAAAIAALGATGGAVVLHPGDWSSASTIVVPDNVWVIGEGRTNTRVICTDVTKHAFRIIGSNCGIVGITIWGGGAVGSGCGIYIQNDGSLTTNPIIGTYIGHIRINGSPSWNIKMPGGLVHAYDVCVNTILDDIVFDYHYADGGLYVGAANTTTSLYKCNFNGDVALSLSIYNCVQVICDHCIFERTTDQVMIHIEITFGVSLIDCYWEQHNVTDPPTAFMNEIWGTCVGIYFERPRVVCGVATWPRFIKTVPNGAGPTRDMSLIRPQIVTKAATAVPTTEGWGANPNTAGGGSTPVRADVFFGHINDDMHLEGGRVYAGDYSSVDVIRVSGTANGYGLGLSARLHSGDHGFLKLPGLLTAQVTALPNQFGGMIAFDAQANVYKFYVPGTGWVALTLP